jgi:DnaJ-class molecular chaperone
MALTFGTDRLCRRCHGDGRPWRKMTKAEQSQRTRELRAHKRAGTDAPALKCDWCGGSGLEPKA